MRILFISNLFPDASRPTFGLHNAGLVRRLGLDRRLLVIAPRPQIGAFLRPPGGSVAAACPCDAAFAPEFPAVPYIPRLGSGVNHRLCAAWLRPAVERAARNLQPHVVLAAWVYPDGCAAIRLASSFTLPCVVIAQGTDVNDYLRFPVRRHIILRHLSRAAAVVTRSEGLRRNLMSAGLSPERVRTIYNGVDTTLFRPSPCRDALRHQLGVAPEQSVMLFVGNLVPVKNPLLTLQALALLRSRDADRRWRLVLVGDGPLRACVETAAAAAGLGEAVVLAGNRLPEDVVRFMQAADVLCVPSRNEGVPNVIREALACGLPVVATRVGGIPEVVPGLPVGELVEADNPEALAAALARALLGGPSAREACRRHALGFSWEETVRQYDDLLGSVTLDQVTSSRTGR